MPSHLSEQELQEFNSIKYVAGLFALVPLSSGKFVLAENAARSLVGPIVSPAALVEYLTNDFERNRDRIARAEHSYARRAQDEISDLDLEDLQEIKLNL